MKFYSLVTCVLLNAFLFSIVDAMLPTNNISENYPALQNNATFFGRLKHDLLSKYDKFSRPHQHYNVTTVQIKLSIFHVNVDEFKSTFQLQGMLHFGWNDDKLKWNESEYGGLNVLRLSDHEIWQPDIFVYNSLPSTSISTFGGVNVLVYPTGSVIWVPPVEITVLCQLDLKYWPFDKQSCSIVLGSWTHSAEEINLEMYNNETKSELLLLAENTEWKITDTAVTKKSTYYPCCTEAYDDITVVVEITRSSTSYHVLIIAPAFVIILLVLASFCLPSQAGEKIWLQGVTAVMVSIIFIFFAQRVPPMGSHTPLVVLFYRNFFYIICCALLESIFCIWISRTEHNCCLPWSLGKLLQDHLRKYLILDTFPCASLRQSKTKTTSDGVAVSDGNPSNENHNAVEANKATKFEQEWMLLAAALDKVSFVICGCLFFVLIVTHSL